MDNLSTWSQRAQKLLPLLPQHTQTQLQGHRIVLDSTLWIEWIGEKSLENLSFSSSWSQGAQVLFLALKEILRGKPLESAKNLSLREIESFLRDRNSEPALPSESFEDLALHWPRIQGQLTSISSSSQSAGAYEFSAGKVFAALSLSEKIQELKAFFSSETLLGLRRSGGRVELLDVQEFDVFIALDSGSVPESALLDWLQLKLSETYREPSLNLIPESFS